MTIQQHRQMEIQRKLREEREKKVEDCYRELAKKLNLEKPAPAPVKEEPKKNKVSKLEIALGLFGFVLISTVELSTAALGVGILSVIAFRHRA